ncbi:2-hydroxycarboxylate transporter family protein [Clostridium sp. Cult3]|uniref:2-hydroxycarboxylate transporter family protein n=1 Tax=Clostridium sp. Cult3 TaxID=2079004 RepID=UPI001F436CCE|nr:2-hydroxycarboxylate transporter family protein [Clostridium sp. Cult3]MCF6460986.1 citrate:sodium symporter [Clostridium sp. Cult3]
MGEKVSNLNDKGKFKIFGMSPTMFAIITVVVLVATYMGVLPAGMIGAFPLMIVLGAILNEIGDRLPIVKDYLGGGPIIIIFGSAALVAYGLIPESSIEIMSNFMKGEGFLDFYIAALITGSILGMDRDLLIKAAARYLPVIFGGVVVSFGLTGLVGALMGYGAKDAILYVALPIMGGGMGAGAVPLSQIFGTSLNVEPAEILSKMVPAVALGNALAIVLAGLMSKLGQGKPNFSGEGKLMKSQAEPDHEKETEYAIDYKFLGMGLLFSTTFFAFGKILGNFIPIHSYALMIITVAIVKAIGIFPKEYEVGAFQWFRFIMVNLTPALLVGIGVAYTDLNEVISAFSITYLVLVTVTVLGAAIGAGYVGKLLGFYPLEASVTGGLCMANMGGTGDVAVLSAANRMELMPFAQISSRIGGAFMLIVATALLKILT